MTDILLSPSYTVIVLLTIGIRLVVCKNTIGIIRLHLIVNGIEIDACTGDMLINKVASFPHSAFVGDGMLCGSGNIVNSGSKQATVSRHRCISKIIAIFQSKFGCSMNVQAKGLKGINSIMSTVRSQVLGSIPIIKGKRRIGCIADVVNNLVACCNVGFCPLINYFPKSIPISVVIVGGEGLRNRIVVGVLVTSLHPCLKAIKVLACFFRPRDCYGNGRENIIVFANVKVVSMAGGYKNQVLTFGMICQQRFCKHVLCNLQSVFHIFAAVSTACILDRLDQVFAEVCFQILKSLICSKLHNRLIVIRERNESKAYRNTCAHDFHKGRIKAGDHKVFFNFIFIKVSTSYINNVNTKVLRIAGNLQGYGGLEAIVKRSCELIYGNQGLSVKNNLRFCIYVGFAGSDTYQALRHVTSAFGLIEVYVLRRNLCSGNNSFDCLACLSTDIDIIRSNFSINGSACSKNAVNVDIELDIILFAASAVVKINTNSRKIFAVHSVGVCANNFEIGNDDLILFCIYGFKIHQIIDNRIHTGADIGKLFSVLARAIRVAQLLDHSFNLGIKLCGIIVHRYAVFGCCSYVIRHLVLVRSTVCEIPNSALYSRKYFCTVKIFCTLNACLDQISLHLFKRNVRIGVCEYCTDMSGGIRIIV